MGGVGVARQQIGRPRRLEERVEALAVGVDLVLVGIEEVAVGMGGDAGCHRGQGVRRQLVVVVEEGDEGGAGQLQRAVAGAGDAAVLAERGDLDASVEAGQRGQVGAELLVARRVVADAQLPVAHRLGEHRADATFERPARGAEHRHEHRHERVGVARRVGVRLARHGGADAAETHRQVPCAQPPVVGAAVLAGVERVGAVGRRLGRGVLVDAEVRSSPPVADELLAATGLDALDVEQRPQAGDGPHQPVEGVLEVLVETEQGGRPRALRRERRAPEGRAVETCAGAFRCGEPC